MPSTMNSDADVPSCAVPAQGVDWARAVSLIHTAIISAALFSMFVFAEGTLSWLGALGIVPIALRVMGCPGCGGTGPVPPPSA